jgi:hypothetical protein
MRVRFPDPDWQEEFTADVRAFLADGSELSYCADARITLAALPDMTWPASTAGSCSTGS